MSGVKCIPLEKLLSKKKPPVLFVGSGFSMRYLVGYPNWMQLLNKIALKLKLSETVVELQYNTFVSEGKTDGQAKQLIGSFLNEKLNELIKADKLEDIFSADELQEIVSQKTSSFKYLVAKMFDEELKFRTDRTYFKTELQVFKSMVGVVPAIITTNYDRLLENLCTTFTPFVEQADYFYSSSVNVAEIYKIHGCASKPNTMVITQRDFAEYNEKSYLTIAKIISLLGFYPMVFIGYSLSDENIKLILENIVNCLNEKQLKQLQDNLIFIERREHVRSMNSYVKEIKLKNKTLNLTYVITDNFTRLFNYISEFSPTLTPVELSKYYRTVRNLVVTQDHKLKNYICSVNENDIEAINAKNLAVAAIGMQEVSYAKLSKEEITLDVLFEKNEYAADKVINIWLTRGTSYRTLVPIFYYYRKCKSSNTVISATAIDKFNSYSANMWAISFTNIKEIDTTDKNIRPSTS